MVKYRLRLGGKFTLRGTRRVWKGILFGGAEPLTMNVEAHIRNIGSLTLYTFDALCLNLLEALNMIQRNRARKCGCIAGAAPYSLSTKTSTLKHRSRSEH